MQYSEGQLGRVFVLRIDDGEDFLVAMQEFVRKKEIRAGSVFFLGALQEGRMVTGPEKPVIPPEPHFILFEGGWEVFGMGTIFPGDEGPMIHYHASVGRAGHALTGCLRERAVTYLVVEAVVIEFNGLAVRREFDEKTRLHLPVHGTEGGTPEKAKGNSDEGSRDEPSVQKDKGDGGDLSSGLADIIRDLTRRPSS
jgi:hypothetical protein